jgi:hypothetical protein
MDRTLTAYILTALMIFAAVAGLAYVRHYSPERVYRRLKRNERARRKADGANREA